MDYNWKYLNVVSSCCLKEAECDISCVFWCSSMQSRCLLHITIHLSVGGQWYAFNLRQVSNPFSSSAQAHIHTQIAIKKDGVKGCCLGATHWSLPTCVTLSTQKKMLFRRVDVAFTKLRLELSLRPAPRRKARISAPVHIIEDAKPNICRDCS